MQRIPKHVVFQATRHKDASFAAPLARSEATNTSTNLPVKSSSQRKYTTSLADTRVSLRVFLAKGASSGRVSSRTCACLSLSMRVSVLNVLLNLAISRIKPPQRGLCMSYFSDGTLIFLLITVTDFASLYHEEIPASKEILKTFHLFVYIVYSLNKTVKHTYFNYAVYRYIYYHINIFHHSTSNI